MNTDQLRAELERVKRLRASYQEGLARAVAERTAVIPYKDVLWTPLDARTREKNKNDRRYFAARSLILGQILADPARKQKLIDFGVNAADLACAAEDGAIKSKGFGLHHMLPLWGGGFHYTGNAVFDKAKFGKAPGRNLVLVQRTLHTFLHDEIDAQLCDVYGIKHVNDMNDAQFLGDARVVAVPSSKDILELDPAAELDLIRRKAEIAATGKRMGEIAQALGALYNGERPKGP